MGTKHFLQSKTILAGIAQLLLGVFLLVTSHTASDKYFAGGVVVTGITTIWGRITAKHKIRWRVKHD